MNELASLNSRRRITVAAHVVLAACMASGLWLLVFGYTPEGMDSRWNYQRIQEGATLREVEALLGRPGEDIANELVPVSWVTTDGSRRYAKRRAPDGVGHIIIALDKDGRVCGKDMFEPSL
jgi:hypothetical protein